LLSCVADCCEVERSVLTTINEVYQIKSNLLNNKGLDASYNLLKH